MGLEEKGREQEKERGLKDAKKQELREKEVKKEAQKKKGGRRCWWEIGRRDIRERGNQICDCRSRNSETPSF